MKKTIISIVIVFMTAFVPVQTQACSFCGYVHRAWNWLIDHVEAAHCISDRGNLARKAGGQMPPCRHKVNHDTVF